MILADAGNIYDAIFMAARAALWDTKVPRTRSVQYKAHKSGKASADMDVDEEVTSGFDTRQVSTAADFELQDYWDEGEVLEGRDRWPVCVTLNLVLSSFLSGLRMMLSTYRNRQFNSSMPIYKKRHLHLFEY